MDHASQVHGGMDAASRDADGRAPSSHRPADHPAGPLGLARPPRTTRRRLSLAVACALMAGGVHAAPSQGVITSGSGTISQNGSTTTIQQNSSVLSLNWQSFNIAAGETVQFQQPGVNTLAINRILGSNGSDILGKLIANGQVWLINPNGVMFGPGAQIDVAGLVASSLGTVSASGSSGQVQFSGSGNASVANAASITVAPGGYVALLGPSVSNTGTITAPRGLVALAAGNQATLSFADFGLLRLQIDQSTLATLAGNSGLIAAPGGTVVLTAGARDTVLASVVNNSGVIRATSVAWAPGNIVLLAGGAQGSVNVAGVLDVSATAGAGHPSTDKDDAHGAGPGGGRILTQGTDVQVADGTTIATQGARPGSWTLSTRNLVVGASGGNLSGATLSAALANGNVVLRSNGALAVDDPVRWGTNTGLTLQATRSLSINADLTASGTHARLALDADAADGAIPASGQGTLVLANAAQITLSGRGASLSIDDVPYTLIHTANDLEEAVETACGHFALAGNLDLAGNHDFGSPGDGDQPAPGGFDGTFNGLGHTISHLSETSNGPAAGLFARIGNRGSVSNLGLVDVSITDLSTGASVGALAGQSSGSVDQVYAIGSVQGGNGSSVGGLIGANQGELAVALAMVAASGGHQSHVGGLIGDNTGAVTNAYATGAASGDVNSVVGGLVGNNSGQVSYAYATGAPTGGEGSAVGGLIGSNKGSLASVYWNEDSSGTTVGVGASGATAQGVATGLAGADTSRAGAYAGFDFASPVWTLYAGHTAPLLTAFLQPLTVSAADQSQVYDGTVSSANLAGASYSIADAATSGHLYGLSTPFGKASQVGTYTADLWSDQFGYRISEVGCSLQITPKPIDVSAVAASKVYDGTTSANVTLSATGLIAGDAVNLSDTGASFSDRNVGTGKTVTVSGIALGGAAAGNYTLLDASTTASAAITARPVDVSAVAANKVYDGTTTANVTLSAAGLVAGETVNLSDAAASFGDRNVGTGKTVTVSGIALGGAAAGNYTLVDTSTTTTASITPKPVSVSATASNKTYDGTTAATVNLTVNGVIGGDTVGAGDAGANFNNQNVGVGKPVLVSGIGLTGSGAGNYLLTNPTALAFADIDAQPLAVTAQALLDSRDASGGILVTTGLIFGDRLMLLSNKTRADDQRGAHARTVVIQGPRAVNLAADHYRIGTDSPDSRARITPIP